jgi:5'-3' exonuclease
MIAHLIDGTYELFRHFYGLRRFNKGKDRPYGAVVGVLQTMLQMIDHVKGSASRGPSDAYLGVATDHVIESFRNRLWADYKAGAGIERALLAQFHPLEEALAAMGVVVWPMIELEADDALASAAHIASKDKKVEKVAIWTPDKDLAQCVRGTRVVQIDGRRKIIRDAAAIREKFGVDPPLIPDLLALVGDAADGYPGIPGIGARTAAQLLNRHGPIEKFPSNVLGEQRDLALLFKNLATLRTDAPLFKKVETLRWRGATPAFAAWAERMKAPRLLERCEKAAIDDDALLALGPKVRLMRSRLNRSWARRSSEIKHASTRRRAAMAWQAERGGYPPSPRLRRGEQLRLRVDLGT